MDSIDHAVATYIRRQGLPLPRVTLGAVNRDGISPWNSGSLIAILLTISRDISLREVLQWRRGGIFQNR